VRKRRFCKKANKCLAQAVRTEWEKAFEQASLECPGSIEVNERLKRARLAQVMRIAVAANCPNLGPVITF